MLPEIKQGHNRKVSKLAAFKFRNSTTFWGISKYNIGPTTWDGMSNFFFLLGGGGGGVSENAQKKLTIKSDNVINKRHTVPI